MLTLGFWGLVGLVFACLVIGTCFGVAVMSMCRVSGQYSEEEGPPLKCNECQCKECYLRALDPVTPVGCLHCVRCKEEDEPAKHCTSGPGSRHYVGRVRDGGKEGV